MNHSSRARTNYVAITDIDALKKAIEPFHIEVQEHPHQSGKHAFFEAIDSAAGITAFTLTVIDIPRFIMPFVAQGDVLILMQAGADEDRNVGGRAVAWVRRGGQIESVSLSLASIYDIAAGKFAIPLDDIAEAVD